MRSNGPGATVATVRSTDGLGVGNGMQSKGRASRPNSIVSVGGTVRSLSPLMRSPGLGKPPVEESIDSRFFHASDMSRQEVPPPKKPEPKKTPTFFYADGKQEERAQASSKASSPVLSAVSDKRTSGPWSRTDAATTALRSPPLLSPGLSSLSSSSPFFAQSSQPSNPRSASPSKENIHLSYRKGASQIFGSRPSPIPSRESDDLSTISERRGSLEPKPYQTPHIKSPSLSSIDSGNSQRSRRRSATTLDTNAPAPSPLSHEAKSATFPKLGKPPADLPSIDTSLDPPESRSPGEGALSPTKSVSELAADARRERKVLDLEISNSSLLAINSSLEREIRRQKSELKRFRRLSRAGKLNAAPFDRAARFSEGLSTLGEEDEEDEDYNAFGPPSGFTDVYDDFSDDDETESITSGSEPLSPSSKQHDRLAKDEKRLHMDLEKHKELLVQSQMMNQSLKRCMYSTEDMIREGKKALDYHVRVSDVKLGGRILTGHEDEEGEAGPEIEVEDETLHGDESADDQARNFLDVWQGLGGNSRPGFEGSEGGDRDSGIEVDKPPHNSDTSQGRIPHSEAGRPPDGKQPPGYGTVRGRPAIRWGNTIS